jgi:hypothetical protein
MSKSASNKQFVNTPRPQIAERQKIQSSLESSKCTGLICQGWISLATWVVFGLLIEGLIGFRAPALLDDSVRREMFRLAHAHGTLLNLVLIAAAICARLDLIRMGRMTSLGLRIAVLLLPIGFLFAGIWHFKDDPGIGILLVPLGAVLLLAAAFQIGFSCVRR